MLKDDLYSIDLKSFWDQHFESHKSEINSIIESNPHFGDKKPRPIDKISEARSFVYPRLEHPPVIKSINVDKTPSFTGTLIAMKGQYLLFDIGVINIRKYTGYHVKINTT